MRISAVAFAAAAVLAACSEQPRVSGKAHTNVTAAPVVRALATSTDPHSVPRDATVASYCLYCHVEIDPATSHPTGRSQAQAALDYPGMYFYPPPSPAIVLVNGTDVECTSCHDDGSAGYSFKNVLPSSILCNACHDEGNGDVAAPTVAVTNPQDGAAVRDWIRVEANVADDKAVAWVELFAGPSPSALRLVTSIAPPLGPTVSAPLDTRNLANGPATLLVRVYDTVGRIATSSVAVTVDNPPDVNVPVVAVTSPAAGAVVQGTISVGATVQDDVGVVRAELWVGPTAETATTLAGSIASPGPSVSFAFDTTQQPDGPLAAVVKAYDAAGNVGSAAVTVTIENPPPDVAAPTAAISSPAAGAVVQGTISVDATVQDDVGVVRAELWIGASVDTATTLAGSVVPSGGAASFTVDTTRLANGPLTAVVKAFDAAGKLGTAAVTVAVRNDLATPTATITAPLDGAAVRGTILATGTVSDDVGVVRAELWVGPTLVGSIDSPPANLSYSVDTTQLPDGAYTAVVRAYDATGKLGTAAVNVTVDNTSPIVAISSPAEGAMVRYAVIIAATAADATSGIARVDFYVDDVLVGTSTSAPYQVSWTPERRSGSHGIKAIATDRAGNTATSATVTVVAK